MLKKCDHYLMLLLKCLACILLRVGAPAQVFGVHPLTSWCSCTSVWRASSYELVLLHKGLACIQT